jgi:hypothetical protein
MIDDTQDSVRRPRRGEHGTPLVATSAAAQRVATTVVVLGIGAFNRRLPPAGAHLPERVEGLGHYVTALQAPAEM